MGTQGVVSVMSENRVVLKFIAGHDGYNAKKVAQVLRDLERIPNIKTAYKLALYAEFGSEDCLVVMNDREEYYSFDESLSPRYRETFHDPEFNPRWAQGTAEHVYVLSM